jgi:hypothetical protein
MTETLRCGPSGPVDDRRLGAIDRSPILLPGRKGGMSLAHLAQEQKPIARRIHRRVANYHRVEERRFLKFKSDKEKRRTLPTLQQFLWEGSRYRTETRGSLQGPK